MKLCGCVNWCRIGWLVVLLNLLFLPNFTFSQNLPPVLDIGVSNQHAEVGSAFSYTLPSNVFKDENNDPLSYSVSGLPAGLSYQAAGRLISGTPGIPGNYTITVNGSDGSLAQNTSFVLYVHPAGATYAAFTMNTQMGCNYRMISFTNLSKNATSYQWTLGNGNQSTIPNPSAIYSTPGAYTVTLTINAGQASESSHSEIIRIYPKPSPGIAPVTISGCEPLDLSLTANGSAVFIPATSINGQNVGAISGGTDLYHYWYFFEQHPARYNTSLPNVQLNNLTDGFYNVMLEVTDANGCQGSRVANRLFEVYDKPDASFAYDKYDNCAPSLTNFYNNSNVNASQIANSRWFVNGIELSDHNDTVQYAFNTYGQFPVSLQTSSTRGCISNLFHDTIRFNNNNTADFLLNNTYCAGDTLSLTAITSAGAVAYRWDLHNNGSVEGNAASFTRVFGQAGEFPLRLTVSYNDDCEIVVLKTIRVDEVLANFNVQAQYSCTNSNYLVNFSNTSTTALGQNINSTRWYLVEGSLQTLLSNQASFTRTFNQSGAITIRMEATSADGCKASADQTIILQQPSVNIAISGATSGCLPAGATQFEASFSSLYETPVSYHWIFGDGNIGSGQSTSHTYATTGNYNVSVSVLTSSGCTYQSTRNNAVRLSNQPVAGAVNLVQAAGACYNQGAAITVNYPAGTDQLLFITATGDETIANPGASPYTYQYEFPDTGIFSVGLVISRYGCASDTVTVDNIRANEPRASFTSDQTTFCEDPPYKTKFTNYSVSSDPATTYSWSFGDGNTSTETSPEHEFAGTGNYNVQLQVYNPTTGCSDSYSSPINIFSFDDAPGIITADETQGCAPLSVNFSQMIASRLSSNYVVSAYHWDFNNDGSIDSTTLSPSIQHQYLQPGTYSVRLLVSSESCDYEFTETSMIKVSGPIAGFSHAPLQTCLNSNISFTNTTTKTVSDTANPLNNTYTWDFGDGNSSNEKDPVHAYSSDGLFNVSLSVNDENGCTSTLTKPELISIVPFEPAFTISDSVFCSNETVTFENLSTGQAVAYHWDFNGDNNTDLISNNLQAVQYSYPTHGVFTVRLTAMAANGCSKAYTQNIRVVNATANFNASSTNIGCAPAFAYFQPETGSDDAISYQWNFGDGNSSTERSPRNYYVTPGKYTVQLTVQFKGGCSKTLTKTEYITVDGAFGVFDYDKTLGCAPNPVLFTVSQLSRATYIDWDFGTGIIDRDTLPSAGTTAMQTTYAYDTLGYRTPKIILTDLVCGEYAYENMSKGSIYTSTAPVPGFKVDFDSICRGVEIHFTDTSRSFDPLYGVSSWKWNFGTSTNDSSKVQNPAFKYQNQGVFSPQLIVTNELGCSDTLLKSNSIHIYSNDFLSSAFDISDPLACPWQSITFTSQADAGAQSTVAKYEWNFGEGFATGNAVMNKAFHDSLKGKSIDIIHRVTDDKFCIDSTIRTVAINHLQAAFGYDPQPVLRGSLVDFQDQSTSDFATTVTSWSWNFENGSPATASIRNPQNINYNSIADDNDVQLIVTNNNNCRDTLVLSLNVLNNPPVVDSFTITLVENHSYLFKRTEFENRFDASDPSQSMMAVRIESASANGSFRLNGVPYPIGASIAPDQLRFLEFVPDPNWNGNTVFQWNAFDGIDWSLSPEWVHVIVLEEPDPPLLSDIVFNLPEDSIVTVGQQHFIDHTYSVLGSSFIFDSLTVVSNITPNTGNFTFNGNSVNAPMLIREFHINDLDSVFRYVPPPGFNGTLQFEWNVNDGYNFADTPAKVIFNYFNTPPALSDIVRTNLKEDQFQIVLRSEFTSHFSDVDRYDTPQRIYLNNLPPASEGTFSINGQNITTNNYSILYSQFNELRFYPAFGFEGTTQVSWGISDGTDIGWALLQLTFINTPPVVHDFTVTGNEDETLFFKLTDFEKTGTERPFEDVDAWDRLQNITIQSLPVHGNLLYNGSAVVPGLIIDKSNVGLLTYLPYPDWYGTDQFDYNASDGTDVSADDAQVFISILPVNDAPRPQPDFYTIPEDEVLTGVSVGANDTDIDDLHSVLRFHVAVSDSATAGANGTIYLNQLGYLTYVPNLDFHGTVKFAYTVCDDDGACARDTVTINVLPLNDAPIALPDTFIIYEDDVSALFNCITHNDYDVDGDVISLVSVRGEQSGYITTAYGNLNWDAQGALLFTLSAGLDTLAAGEMIDLFFAYTIVDSWNAGSSSNFIIRIMGRNNPPVAVADEYNIYEGEAYITSGIPGYGNILDNDSDPENNPLQIASVNLQSQTNIVNPYGTFVWASNGSWSFTQNLAATDSLFEGENVELIFPYTITDGLALSTPSLITINIIGLNDAPVAEDNYLNIFEDAGSVSIHTGETPALLSNDSDVDGDALLVIGIEGSSTSPVSSAVGLLEWHPEGSYTYTPNIDSVKQLAEGQTISDIFTYIIQDAFGATDTALLIINITGKNDAPFAQDDFLSIYEDSHITEVEAAKGLLVNDGDIDHDPIVVAVNGVGTRTLNGNYGTLSWDSTGAFIYVTNIAIVDTLHFGEMVNDVFTYVVNDPSGETDMAVLTITIIGENDAPVARDFTDSISENQMVLNRITRETGILSNDTDIDDGLNFGIIEVNRSVTSPVNGKFGTLEWFADGTFTYTLNPATDTLSLNEVVIDSFLYQIKDAFDSTATAWFYMVITGENDHPLASNDTLRLTEDILLYAPDWSLLDNDGDRDGDPIGMSRFGGQTVSPVTTRFAAFDWENWGNIVYNRYVPNSIFNGLDTLAFDDLMRDSIPYTITDQYGVESMALLFLEIQGVNDAPITLRDVNFISEISLQVASSSSNGLLANDRDVDRRDSIALLNVQGETNFSTEGVYGTLTWNPDGSYVYYNRFESTDSLALSERVHDLFSYQVIDLQGAISTDTLDITIIGSNDRPVAVNDTISIWEDEQYVEIHPASNGLMWNDYDVDRDSIKVQIAGNAGSQELVGIYGILEIYENGQATYRLNTGMDSLYHEEIVYELFSYTIADIHGVKDEAKVLVVITGNNDAPQALGEFFSIDEDTEQLVGNSNNSLLINDSDIDGDFLQLVFLPLDPSFTIQGIYGQLVWNPNGEFTFQTNLEITNQLALGDTVQEVFEYIVFDPFVGSDTTQLMIEIIGVNDAPVALANFYLTRDVMALEVTPNDTTTLLYNDYDVDGNIQVVTLVNQLPNDTIVGQWGTLIWKPDGSFIYLPDSALAIALRPDEINTDIFTYTIEDEWGASDSAFISFIIEGINNGPVALNDTIFIMEDQLTGLPENPLVYNDWDPDRDSLQVIRIELDTTGVMTGFYGEVFWSGNGNVVFTPNRFIIDQLGPDDIKTEAYTYTIIDEGGLRSQADLIIYIIGENDPVVANDDIASLYEDEYIQVDVMANDTDPDNMQDGNWAKTPVTIILPPKNGRAYVNSFNGIVSYFPNADYYGPDSLQYRVCDDEGSCDLAWVRFEVIPVNDPPVATHLILKTNIDTPVSFNAFDQVEDIDDGIDPASLIFNNPHLSYQDSMLTYTPESGFSGHDEFVYSLADYAGERAYVIVTVLIPDGGDGAQDDWVSTSENTPVHIAILLNDTLNGFVPNPLSVDIKIFPVNGVAAYDPFAQKILYQPANNYNGTDQLTYLVSSEQGIWDYATIFISVEPVNSPIEANDDARSTNINQTLIIPVLLNDVDEDNGIDFHSFQFLSSTSNGNATYNPATGFVTYQPQTDYKGNDRFTYRICDLDPNMPSCDTATVFILVKSKFDDLQANNDTISTPENTPVLITYNFLISNDVVQEGSIDSSSFEILSLPQHGQHVRDSLNNLMYIPTAHYFGPDWITYQICDNNGSCDMAEINIWVEERNTAPIAGDDYYVVTENTTKRLYILSNDFDYDGSLDWTSLQLTNDLPENGSVEIDHTTGTIFYTPSVNASVDEFSYQICDNEGACTIGKVYITIDLGSTILYNQVTFEDTPDTIVLGPLLALYNFKSPVLDFLGVDGPGKGSWEFIDNNTRLVYYPAQDETGADYYNIKLFFAGPDTADLKVTVTILPVNDAPVAMPDTVIWPTGAHSVSITFDHLLQNDYDVDGDPFFLSLYATGHGDSLHIVFNPDSTITISADTVFWCDSWFSYEISDPDGATGTGMVSIIPEPQGITAKNDSLSIDENSATRSVDILQNDWFMDLQRCTIDTLYLLVPPRNGHAAISEDKLLLYQPNAHYYGPDSLQYIMIDIWGQRDTAWVIIDVIQRNTPPVAVDDVIGNNLSAAIYIPVLANDYDPDPDGWIDSIRTVLNIEPQYGTVWFNADSGFFVYQPQWLSCEADQFTYTIFDNEGDSATATVVLEIPDEAPLFALTDTVRTWPGIAVHFNVLANDGGYFIPVVEAFTYPQNGTLEQTGDSSFVFYPDQSFMGNDQMTYQLVSPCGNEKTGIVVFLIEELRVPEIITPNNDTKNDVLIIDGIEHFPDAQLQIFNRYGHIVYQRKGYANDWDGYSNQGNLGGNKALPTGSYYYTLIYNEGLNRQAGLIYIYR